MKFTFAELDSPLSRCQLILDILPHRSFEMFELLRGYLTTEGGVSVSHYQLLLDELTSLAIQLFLLLAESDLLVVQRLLTALQRFTLPLEVLSATAPVSGDRLPLLSVTRLVQILIARQFLGFFV